MMQKMFNAYCPTLKRNNEIAVDYIDASTLANAQYIKGTFYCEYASMDNRCPIANQCPIYSGAPHSI